MAIEDDTLAEETELADSFKDTIYAAVLQIDKATSKTTPV